MELLFADHRQPAAEKSRHMLNLPDSGFAWNEIGRALLMSGKAAKSRFYYALNKYAPSYVTAEERAPVTPRSQIDGE